jgi:TonB-dependent receptor
MPSNLVAGVRYEETDVTSTSNVRTPGGLEWQDDNDWAIIAGGTATPFSRSTSYDNLLPNIDFDISPTDNLKARLSYSETIGRAAYAQLSSDISLTSAYLLTATGGNPTLKPMESKNIDVSVEWYYSDDSYISAGYFVKDVSNYIGQSIVTSDWYGIKDPRKGPRFEQARANVIAAGLPVTEKTLHNAMLAIEGLDPAVESTSIYARSDDQLAQWATAVPGNNKDAKIDGFEFAVQHWFGDSGFGVQANYTMVDADVGYDNLLTTDQFVMIGLSDSANFIGFYDKDAWQIRVAYNWRDEFINSTVAGGGFNPSYTEEFAQIDFSLSYDITDQVTVSLEGLNVTGENSRTHGRAVNQLNNLEDLGARYLAGVRYTF